MNCEFDEPKSKTEIAIAWALRLSFVLALMTMGGAIGAYQMANYMVDEIEAQFTCEPK